MIGLMEQDTQQAQPELLCAEFFLAATLEKLRIERRIAQGESLPRFYPLESDVHFPGMTATKSLMRHSKGRFPDGGVAVAEASAETCAAKLHHHQLWSAKQNFVVSLAATIRNFAPIVFDCVSQHLGPRGVAELKGDNVKGAGAVAKTCQPVSTPSEPFMPAHDSGACA